MSRLGKLPINMSSGTQAVLAGSEITFKGPKGEFKLAIHPAVEVVVAEGSISVAPKDKDSKDAKAFWGLMWKLISNAVEGVTTGFTRKLEINGVGYRAALSGRQLNMSLGYSHPIEFKLPDGVDAAVEGSAITLTGIDKALLGETASQIRKLRRPEPYKGKGVKYAEEVIRRKAGKAAAKGK